MNRHLAAIFTIRGFRSSIGGLVIHYESRIYPRSARVRRDAGYAGLTRPEDDSSIDISRQFPRYAG